VKTFLIALARPWLAKENRDHCKPKVKSDRTVDLEAGASNSPEDQRQQQKRCHNFGIQKWNSESGTAVCNTAKNNSTTAFGSVSSTDQNAGAGRDHSSPPRRKTATAKCRSCRQSRVDAAESESEPNSRLSLAPQVKWTLPSSTGNERESKATTYR
jgi:hypothetical protein